MILNACELLRLSMYLSLSRSPLRLAMGIQIRFYAPVKYSGSEVSISTGWISSFSSSPGMQLLASFVGRAVLDVESIGLFGGSLVAVVGSGGGGALFLSASSRFCSFSSAVRSSLILVASLSCCSDRCVFSALARVGLCRGPVVSRLVQVLFGCPQVGSFLPISLCSCRCVPLGIGGFFSYFLFSYSCSCVRIVSLGLLFEFSDIFSPDALFVQFGFDPHLLVARFSPFHVPFTHWRSGSPPFVFPLGLAELFFLRLPLLQRLKRSFRRWLTRCALR